MDFSWQSHSLGGNAVVFQCLKAVSTITHPHFLVYLSLTFWQFNAVCFLTFQLNAWFGQILLNMARVSSLLCLLGKMLTFPGDQIKMKLEFPTALPKLKTREERRNVYRLLAQTHSKRGYMIVKLLSLGGRIEGIKEVAKDIILYFTLLMSV